MPSRHVSLKDTEPPALREGLRRLRAGLGVPGEFPADLLALYDKIRVRSGGLGAAALRGHRCSGCQLEATPTALAEYAAAAEDDVLRCEECERVLVRVGTVDA